MSWLVRTNTKQFEVWSETEYQNRLMKCEYYGARPFWKKIRKLNPPESKQCIDYKVGEVIPYKRSTLGKHFAVIIKLFSESGQNKFMGIDIETKSKIVAPITH